MATRPRYPRALRTAIVVIIAAAGVLAAAPLPLALPNIPPSFDANTLVAVPAPSTPTLDGTVDPAWTAAIPIDIAAFGGSGSFPSGSGINVRAMYDSSRLYLLIQWADATEDYSKDAWQLQDNTTAGGIWARTAWGDDALSLLWDDGQGLEQNFSASGCGPLCHTGAFTEMRTDAGTLDAWHWSSSITAPRAYADDRYLDSASKANGSATGGWHPDAPDADVNNTITTAFGERPAFLNGSVPLAQSARSIAAGDSAPINWLTFNSSSMPKGTTVPGYVLFTPGTASIDPAARAVWNNSTWTLEISRPLTTTDNASRDIAFDDLDATYFFSVGVFDNKTLGNHSTAGFVYKMIFADNLLPDLTPEAVTLAAPATLVNATVNGTVRVRNMGFGGTSGAVFLTVIDAGTLAQKANISVPSIAWGEFYLANFSFSAVGYAVGQHAFRTVVDTSNAEVESFETNNTRDFNVTIVASVTPPDLTVSFVASPPTVVYSGDAWFINGTVENVGVGDSVGDVWVRAGHPLFGFTDQNLGPVLAGAFANFSMQNTAAGIAAGSYGFSVIVDPDDNLSESTENNNSAVVVVNWEDRFDLVGVELSADPAAGTGGAVLLMNLTIENRGAAFNGTLAIAVYLDDGGSTNGTNRTDVWSTTVALARGANATISNAWGIPALIAPGTHLVRAWVDASRNFDEVIETNNNATVQILALIPPRPDLEVTDLSIAAAFYRPSEQASISVNITNNGVAYSGTVRLEVTDATLDRVLGNITIPAIAAGATQTFTATFAIPAGTAGVHSLLVVVDADGVLDEEAELNNALAITYILLNPAAPDLDVTSPAFSPAEPTAGDTVTVTATVRNVGDAASPSSTLSLSWVATSLGTVNVPALGVGETYAATFAWNTSGVHSLSAILSLSVDSAGGADTNLSNNALQFVVTFTQAGAPSLHITPITVAPATVNPGERVRIEVTVSNTGTAPGAVSLRIVAGQAEINVTSFTLEPGASRLITVNWTAAGAGNVTLRAELTSGGSTIETRGGLVSVTSITSVPPSTPWAIVAAALVALAAIALLVMLTMRRNAARDIKEEEDAAGGDGAPRASDEEE